MFTPVQTQGLRELRRDLRAVDRGLALAVFKEAREAVVPIALAAQTKWNSRPGPRTGRGQHLVFRPFVSGASFGIRTNHPGAGWLQWGGRISPRGVDIVRTPATAGVGTGGRAVEEGAEHFVDELADRVDALAIRHGWRR